MECITTKNLQSGMNSSHLMSQDLCFTKDCRTNTVASSKNTASAESITTLKTLKAHRSEKSNSTSPAGERVPCMLTLQCGR